MTAPFMRAYTELLVSTCHRRGAFAMGGMAAFIPSRRDPEVNERALAQVREDKEREAGDGFDGSWVAHPDLVPVCREVFDAALGDRPEPARPAARRRPSVTREQLLDLAATPGAVTEAGVAHERLRRAAVPGGVARRHGAVGINNLMEDAATAEISRSQIWQWVHNGTPLENGRPVTAELVRAILAEETAKLEGLPQPGARRPSCSAGRARRRLRGLPHRPGLRAGRRMTA